MIKIQTSLQKGAVFPIALAILVSLGLFLKSRHVAESRVYHERSRNILQHVQALDVATHMCLIRNNETTRKKWETKYISLESLLGRYEPADLVEEFVRDEITSGKEGIRTRLSEILSIEMGAKSAGDTTVKSSVKYMRLQDEILTEVARMLEKSSNLVSNAASDLKQTQRNADTIFLVFVAVFSMLMAGGIMAAGQSTVGRLKNLRDAADSVAQGDLDVKLKAGVNDEVGQALRSFNRLVHNLRETGNTVRSELDEVKKDSAAQKRAVDAAKTGSVHLADALTRLKRAQKQIIYQERLHALEQIGAGVTRDFNAVLTPILTTSDFLLSYPEHVENRDELIDSLKKINSAAEDARKQVRRLSEVFRPHEGGTRQCVDLNEIVESAVSFSEPHWKSSATVPGNNIVCKTKLSSIPLVEAVTEDLTDAVVALIFNSCEAMPEGGVIKIKTKREGDTVVMTIADTGTGMAQDVKSRALEPFFSTKGSHHSGMGLTAALGAAGRFGGSFDIDTEEGKGTTITMTLPVCKDGSKIAQGKKDGREDEKLNILVVDDEEWVRKIVAKSLEAEGHLVTQAKDGKSGIECAAKGNFDLVILDRAMPDMMGDDVAREMKKHDPDVPVILLTGFGDVMRQDGEHPEGIDLIVSKPVTVDELRNAVRDTVAGASG
jgi:signal transduction histidine kinase/CheY-like chemotaxis protein